MFLLKWKLNWSYVFESESMSAKSKQKNWFIEWIQIKSNHIDIFHPFLIYMKINTNNSYYLMYTYISIFSPYCCYFILLCSFLLWFHTKFSRIFYTKLFKCIIHCLYVCVCEISMILDGIIQFIFCHCYVINEWQQGVFWWRLNNNIWKYLIHFISFIKIGLWRHHQNIPL